MSKHTSGPWRYEKDKFNDGDQVSDQQTGSICATDADGLEWFICAIEDMCIDSETEANARLIAASIEMLPILEQLPDAGDDSQLLHELIKKACEITARVEGEQDGKDS